MRDAASGAGGRECRGTARPGGGCGAGITVRPPLASIDVSAVIEARLRRSYRQLARLMNERESLKQARTRLLAGYPVGEIVAELARAKISVNGKKP